MPIRCGRPTSPTWNVRGYMYLVAIMDCIAARFCLGGSPTAWSRISVWRHSRKPSAAMGGLRSSTPIKAPSLPAPLSPRFSKITASHQHGRPRRCQDNISSSGYGGPSNITTCTCIPSAADRSCGRVNRMDRLLQPRARTLVSDDRTRMRFIMDCLIRSLRQPDASHKIKKTKTDSELIPPSGCPNIGVHRPRHWYWNQRRQTRNGKQDILFVHGAEFGSPGRRGEG